MLPLVLLSFAFTSSTLVWTASRRTNALHAAGPSLDITRYLTAISADNAAWAAQSGAVACIIANVLPTPFSTALIALAFAFSHGLIALDTALFLDSGMRLQRSLLSFAGALTEFADNRPWRRQAAACAAVVLLLAALALTALAAQPETFSWSAPPLLLAVSAGFIALGARLRTTLPMHFTYEWNNRLVTVQLTAASNLARRRQQREHAPAANKMYDARGVPNVFAPVNETAAFEANKYPLLRQNQGFSGAKHFELKLDPGEKPHVVFLFLESFRAADTGVLGAKHRESVTPCIDKLSRDGILWSNFYANGTITSRAMTAAFYGVLPDFREYSMQAAETPPALLGMPHMFAERGYLPAYFCDGPMDWENKRDFFLHHGFPLYFGTPSIKAAYPEAPNSEWNFSDEYLMRFHADWLEQQDKLGQPTFSSVLTVTNHTPWEAPDGAPIPNVDIDPASDYGRFLRTMMYTDKCVGLYMDLMRERGLDKKTVFFIMGDHGQQVEQDLSIGWSGRYNDGSVRVPLLMLAPGRVQPTVIKETASQIDLLPTVIDLFDLRARHHAMGNSLVRPNDARTALTIHPWAPGMVSNRVGPLRYVFSFDAHKSALYDLSRDPGETVDVSALHPELVAEQTELAWAMRGYVNRLHSEMSFAPPFEAPYSDTTVRLRGAPDDFPLTYEACAKRAHDLCLDVRDKALERKQLHSLGALMIAISGEGLDEPMRLRLAQLLLAKVNIKTMGELTRAEEKLMHELDGALLQSEADTPAWLRALATTVRRVAGIRISNRQSARPPK